jgi:hypothetical protein
MLAADLMEDMYMSAKVEGDPRDKREAFKTLMQAGGLDMTPRGRASVGDTDGSPQVVINLPPGIPGVTPGSLMPPVPHTPHTSHTSHTSHILAQPAEDEEDLEDLEPIPLT